MGLDGKGILPNLGSLAQGEEKPDVGIYPGTEVHTKSIWVGNLFRESQKDQAYKSLSRYLFLPYFTRLGGTDVV